MSTLRVLQVAPSDRAGGAERSALNLHRSLHAMGQESWLAVGRKRGDVPGVVAIPGDASRNGAVRLVDGLIPAVARLRGAGRLLGAVRAAAEPVRTLDRLRGREDFHHPGSRRLLSLVPGKVDVLHLHNLHGDYFDLRQLPVLAAQVPTVLNLRDAWLLSGHCAYGLECERWRHGCGECPDLNRYPAVRRDATAFNWQRKKALYQRSKVYLTAPSRWLLDQARASALAPAIVDARVVGNGVDTGVFTPGPQDQARERLGLPADGAVLMTAANGIRGNVWKDFRTLGDALARLGETGRDVTVLAVGEAAPEARLGSVRLRFVPFVADDAVLADHYRAADLYVHAARVESFGNTVLEAAACGVSAVSTAVGGIPEHVRSLDAPSACTTTASHQADEASGVLTPPGDAAALADAITMLLDDAVLRARLADNAARAAQSRSLERQATEFLDWYREIVSAATEARS